MNADGSVQHPGLANHAVGSLFGELVRRFNEEETNEAADERSRRQIPQRPSNRQS
jgi:type I restriction enzyme M protein